jgi:PhoH-like ATPase
MKKIFVLDTNVLLHDPNAIFAFEEHEVIIPAVVLEEIDSKKRNADEIGRNARNVSRLLDGLRELGHLHSGVPLANGGNLKVELNHRSFVRVQEMFGEVSNDNRILAVALNYQIEENEKEVVERQVVLVSKDVLVRIKADVLGLITQDYLSDRTAGLSELYPGYTALKVHPSVIDEFYTYRFLPIKPLQLSYSLYPNEFVILKDEMSFC